MKICKSLIIILSLILLTSCSLDKADDDRAQQEREFTTLLQLKKSVEELAKSVPCTENSECDFVAFGSKPCGGPWVYLAYNKAIDEDLFLQKVQEFNSKEDSYNRKWELISDCSTPSPPVELGCVNGVCTIIK